MGQADTDVNRIEAEYLAGDISHAEYRTALRALFAERKFATTAPVRTMIPELDDDEEYRR